MKKLISFAVCLCVLFSMLPAMSLAEQTIICEYDEHTHTDECYLDDALICDKEAHTHTNSCFKADETIEEQLTTASEENEEAAEEPVTEEAPEEPNNEPEEEITDTPKEEPTEQNTLEEEAKNEEETPQKEEQEEPAPTVINEPFTLSGDALDFISDVNAFDQRAMRQALANENITDAEISAYLNTLTALNTRYLSLSEDEKDDTDVKAAYGTLSLLIDEVQAKINTPKRAMAISDLSYFTTKAYVEIDASTVYSSDDPANILDAYLNKTYLVGAVFKEDSLNPLGEYCAYNLPAGLELLRDFSEDYLINGVKVGTLTGTKGVLGAPDTLTLEFDDFDDGSGSFVAYPDLYTDLEITLLFAATFNVPAGKNQDFDFGNNVKLTVNVYDETISFTATKTWVGDNNIIRPGTLDLTLYANGAKVYSTPSVKKDGSTWTYEWSNLTKYSGSTEISYSVDEENVPSGYIKRVLSNSSIQNTYNQTSFKVDKIWDDGNGSSRPSSLTVTLYKNGAAERTVPTVTKNGNTWTYEWNNLDRFDSFGDEIIYSAKEDIIPAGYVSTVSPDGLTIINTLVKDYVATKVWEDGNNKYSTRTSIGITLYADGKPVGSEVSFNKDTASYTWRDLPVYEGNREIKYTIDETTVPKGYLKQVNGNTITNTLVKDITVTKVWKDNDNKYDLRDDYGITLYANGKIVNGEVILDKDTTSYTWKNLPVFADNDEIEYTIDETTVPEGYKKTVKENTITNTRIAPQKISIWVTKIWDDDDDYRGERPESVTIRLYKNGEKTNKTLVLTEDDDWKGKFTKLDDIDDNGKEIVYTIKEDKVDGYTNSITGSIEKGFKVKNTIKFDEPTPQTGDTRNPLLWAVLLIAAGAGMAAIAVVAIKRKNSKR